MRTAMLVAAVVFHAGSAWAGKPLPQKAKLDAAKIAARDRYFKELRQANEEKLKTFLDAADATNDDDARQAALYLVVADAAVDDGQVRLALEAMDRLGREFEFDALAGKLKLLESANKSARGVEARSQLVNRLLELVDEASDARRFDVADQAATLGESVAVRLRDAKLRKDIAARKTKVEARRRENVAAKAALARAEAVLKDDPDDAEANRVVGLRLAADGQWAEALAHLSRADDEELRQAALADSGLPDDPSKQIGLADAWWQLADGMEGDANRDALRTRAVFWYSRALAGANGFRRTRAERRIKLSGDEATAAATAQTSGDDNLADVLLAPGVSLRLVKIPGDGDGKIKPFWLAQTEMTETQWAALGGRPAIALSMPVVNISFNDCRRMCARLNAGPVGRRYRFRLPTKEEFAHACGKPTTYSGELTDYAWCLENSPERTQPVGQKKANPFGLFDILGNVWEFGDDGKFYGISAWDTLKNPLPAFMSVELPANYQGQRADYLGGNVGVRLAADLR